MTSVLLRKSFDQTTPVADGDDPILDTPLPVRKDVPPDQDVEQAAEALAEMLNINL